MQTPSRLRAGARVALIAPAGPVTDEKIDAALARCEAFGLLPVPGASVRERTGYLAGSDALRLADLARAIEDPSIDAIWALRGGYGTMRLLCDLDLHGLTGRPRPYIGFSDNTAIHLALSRTGLVSFHGPHAAGDFPPMTEACFRRVLFDATPPGELPTPSSGTPATIVSGTARGRLAGGNLSLLAAACGTACALRADGAILFLEDIGEPAYRVDRSLTQLRLAGCLEGVAGLVIGRFTEAPDTGDSERPDAGDFEGPDPGDAGVAGVLREFAVALGVPAISGAPIGHVAENWTLPVGCMAELRADIGALAVIEPAVA